MYLIVVGEPRVFAADRFDAALFLPESRKFYRFHADDIRRVVAIDRVPKLTLPAEFNEPFRDVLDVLVVSHTHLHATVNRRQWVWAGPSTCLPR
jgi:hypothetical protein